MPLLPLNNDVKSRQEGEIEILDVDDNETEDVFKALSSDTARRVLQAVYDEPAPASALAERLDLSLQNASYHLENLVDAGVIEVADTHYSDKGTEMAIYAPVNNPIVLFIGTDERKNGLLNTLKRFISAIVLLSAGSVFIHFYQVFSANAGRVGRPTINSLLAVPGFEFLLGGTFIVFLSVIWWVYHSWRV